MGKFDYDGTGVRATQFSVVPKGTYHVVIVNVVEKTTANGDPMVRIECDVDEKNFVGAKVWYNVTFLSRERKGAGLAVHFLKTIGEPFEGKFTVDPDHWIGKRFLADIVLGEYNGRPQNQIAALNPVSDGRPADPAVKKTSSAVAEDEVPF